METISLDCWAARKDSELVRAYWWYDEHVGHRIDSQGPLRAYCVLCRASKPMELLEGINPAAMDPREHVICRGCGMNARVRAVLDLARNHVGLGGDRHVYIMEQVTRAFVWMQQHLHCEVTGSEFESDSRKRLVLSDYLHRIGGVGSIEFNDVTCSRYEDSTFDAVVSFEVLEHVPNYPSALAELSRNLKDGGLLIATFPFADTQETIVRARLDEQGKVEHLLEPEYHGDTISGGILCWYHFGWDILDACAKNGFRRAKMVMPWNPAAGMHFGHWILMAIK